MDSGSEPRTSAILWYDSCSKLSSLEYMRMKYWSRIWMHTIMWIYQEYKMKRYPILQIIMMSSCTESNGRTRDIHQAMHIRMISSWIYTASFISHRKISEGAYLSSIMDTTHQRSCMMIHDNSRKIMIAFTRIHLQRHSWRWSWISRSQNTQTNHFR